MPQARAVCEMSSESDPFAWMPDPREAEERIVLKVRQL
jgi:hypothetical protein